MKSCAAVESADLGKLTRVLFICTGNYYRSRFAEAVCNYEARRNKLPVRAFSRGLAIHLVQSGELSFFTAEALRNRNIDLCHTGSARVQLDKTDLEASDIRIALKESEHRPMMRKMFPAWENSLEYWDFEDIVEGAPPDHVLPAIEARVKGLLFDISRKAGIPAFSRSESVAVVEKGTD